jgi:serine/threonine protein kinase
LIYAVTVSDSVQRGGGSSRSARDLPTEAASRATPGADPRRATARHRDAPTKIGRFTIVRELGSGGMGFVLVGRDEQLHRDVAIKLLRAERGSTRDRQRLEREAQALAQLSDPNVVPIFEVGDHEGELYIAMELVVGDSLRAWVRNGERTWQQIVAVYLQAARGLAAAHSRGLVHRDFKPENVLVGDDGRVRVVDFGLVAEAGILAPDEPTATSNTDDILRTQTGEFLGTPRYMAPEQFVGGHVGPAADQFAWCVALFEALSKTRPFEGTSVSELATAVTSVAPRALPPGPYPRALAAVLERGLARVASRRHASMNELVTAIERATARRIPWRPVAAIAGATIAAIAWLVMRPSPPEPTSSPIETRETVRLEGPQIDAQIEAQGAFAAAHEALARGEAVLAARHFDDAAAKFEAHDDHGEDLARIQLDRAIAHYAAWNAGGDGLHLVTAQELLRRTIENHHQHPEPAPLQARATELLAQVEEHATALAKARGVDDPARRFLLVRFDVHPAGTQVESSAGKLCLEPCTIPLATHATAILRFSHSGYHDVVAVARVPGLGKLPPPPIPMRRVMPNETYVPRPLSSFSDVLSGRAATWTNEQNEQ